MSLSLPQNKLKFNVERDILKKKLSFELEKLNEKTRIVTSRDDILNFGILCIRKNKEIGKKMLHEIYKRYSVVGLQGFDNYKNLNPIEVSLDSNSLINKLFKS